MTEQHLVPFTGVSIAIQQTINELLARKGRNPTDHPDEFSSTSGTGARWGKALEELTRGYDDCPKEILGRRFESSYDELVLVDGIKFHSLCEHHLLPFSGIARVAYLPKKDVVGLSKLARLVDCFSRRLQIQERLTMQIAQSIMTELDPQGAACVIEATHSCMACRGVKKTATMSTSVLLGLFRDHGPLRSEFLGMLKR